MSHPSENVRRASRIYERLLWIYPRVHRHEYGPLMAQLFRDQCRAGSRGGNRWALAGLVLRALPDLALSAFREHVTEQTTRMKNMPPRTLSLILFIAGIGAAALSCAFIPGRLEIAAGLAYFSALVFLVRAFVEGKRPENELIRSLIWGAIVAVIFGFIMPVWGPARLPIIPLLVMVPVFANAFVPLFRAGRVGWRRRSG